MTDKDLRRLPGIGKVHSAEIRNFIEENRPSPVSNTSSKDLRAFPSSAIDPVYAGMTLRDWFAGQALAGWMATYAGADNEHPSDDGADPQWARNISAASYRMADAMMVAREIRS